MRWCMGPVSAHVEATVRRRGVDKIPLVYVVVYVINMNGSLFERPPMIENTERKGYDVSGNERDTGLESGVKGIVEEVKGRAKEAAGKLVGNESLEREGQAQQDKAEAQREVAAKEAGAEKARAEAAVHEARQRAEQ